MEITKNGLQMPVRNFHKWRVKEPVDQIALMSGNQARIALIAISEGKTLNEAIPIAFSYPPHQA